MSSNKHINPPRWAERFFRWICHQTRMEDLSGDLYEIFEQDLEEYGKRRAKFNYIWNVLTLTRPSIIRNPVKTEENMDTISHYFKTAIRTSVRNPSAAFISLVGLIISFTIVLLVVFYVGNKANYDQHISENERVFRVYNETIQEGSGEAKLAMTSPQYAPTLRQNYPEIELSGRISAEQRGRTFTLKEDQFEYEEGLFIEPEIIEILDIEIIEGSASRLSEPNTILLSEETYHTLFGDKQLGSNSLKSSGLDVNVIGIYKNFPYHSHIRPPYLMSLQTAVQSVTEERMTNWIWSQFHTYIKLKEGTDVQALQRKFQAFVKDEVHPITKEAGFVYNPVFQNVTDIHLNSSEIEWDLARHANPMAIRFMSIAAIILLLIALSNFINLFSIQTMRKLKEFGIRKSIGAHGGQIITQLVVYCSMYLISALVIAAGLFYLLLPKVEFFISEELFIQPLISWLNIGIFIGLLVLIMIICTFYPAILSRKFKAHETIYGIPTVRSRSIDPRMVLIGLQFVLSIALIFSSILVRQQFIYLSDKDMGFNPERLLEIQMPPKLKQNTQSLKAEWLKKPGIEAVSFGYGTPGGVIAGDGVLLPHADNKNVSIAMIIADPDYISTYGMEMAFGRDFNDSEVDYQSAFIINESAISALGFGSPKDALGSKLAWNIWGMDSLKRGEIIGIVSDFNTQSLHNPITPLVMHMDKNNKHLAYVRTNQNNIQQTLFGLKESVKSRGVNEPLQYQFVNSLFEKEYRSEQQLSIVILTLGIIAVIMAIIGMIAIITFHLRNQIKSISIRKILGATDARLLKLLSKQYFILLMVSLALTLPIIGFLMQNWLETYAFHVNIESFHYILVIVITLVLTLGTVIGISYKTLQTNLIENIRSE